MVALVEVVNATKDVCRGDPDQEWIEQVTMRVDTCAAEVQDYIDARKDDAPSFASLTESWVRSHTPAGARSENGYADNIISNMAHQRIRLRDLKFMTPIPLPRFWTTINQIDLIALLRTREVHSLK